MQEARTSSEQHIKSLEVMFHQIIRPRIIYEQRAMAME